MLADDDVVGEDVIADDEEAEVVEEGEVCWKQSLSSLAVMMVNICQSNDICDYTCRNRF